MSFFVNSFVHDYILIISNISLMSFIFANLYQQLKLFSNEIFYIQKII